MLRHLRDVIVIPRWLLTAKYAVFVLVGVAAFVASSPSAEEVSPNWVPPIWSILLAAASLSAMIGSLSRKTELLEQWSCVAVASLFLFFATAPVIVAILRADPDRILYGAIALGFSLLPILRAVQLLSQVGKRRRTNV